MKSTENMNKHETAKIGNNTKSKAISTNHNPRSNDLNYPQQVSEQLLHFCVDNGS